MCVVLSIGMLAGCGNNDSQEAQSGQKGETEYKDTIVYSLDSTPTGNWIPVTGMSDYDGSVSEVIYPSMLAPDPSGELQNYLATDYKIDDSGLVYTFTIHDDAVWSDGEPVTTEDIEFTFMLLSDPDNEDIFSEGVERIKGVKEYKEGTADTVEGIKVIDDYTIEFTFETPYAKSLSIVGEMGIMPKHIWEGVGFADLDNQDRAMIETPVVCGPYKVVEFVANEHVQLVANEDFFLGEPLTKNFYFKVVNADSVTAELTSGAVDIAAVTNLTKDELEELDNDGFDIKYFYYDLFQCMRFNLDRNYSQDFRNALAYAVDRQSIVDDLMEGRGIVCNVIISAGSWAYPTDVKGVEKNVDTAKELLEKAGYVDVNGDGMVEDPNGNEFTMTLAYPQGLVVREQSAVVIQENLKEIGINVELNCVDFPTLMTIMNEKTYDIMLMGHGVDSVDPDPTSFMESLGFSDEAKEVTAKAAATNNQNERKELYKQLAEIQQAETPVLTLYCQEKAYAYNDKMINYEAGTFSNFTNIHTWAIEK